MPELICEEIAHQSGFTTSIGNWIAPDGTLVTGKNYESHHWETIKAHLGIEPKTDNHLSWMNQKIKEGFIRLVFRSDVLFQVGCEKKEELHSDKLNYVTLQNILKKIPEVEIHIFSRTFYVIGKSKNVTDKRWEKLQIHES